MQIDQGGPARPIRELRVLLVPDATLDDDEREGLALRLRSELSELDIESLSSIDGPPAPVGSKGAETWGDLLITLSAGGGVFTTVLLTIQDWLRRHRGEQKVKIVIDGDTLELSNASKAQQSELLHAFIRKHSGM